MPIDPSSALVFRNGVTARNRCALAAITNRQSHADGTLSDDEYAWLVRRAAGGFGVVVTCASHVTRDGQGWAGELGCFDDALVPGLTRLAAGIRATGARGLVQIFHGGLRADPAVTGTPPWTAHVDPSIPGIADGVRAGTGADIARVIEAFAAAAMRCHRAGWDGVELHGAHGYLLTQFLSNHNQRADGWGGDLVGRMRLARACLTAVRARVPATFVVGVRLSPESAGQASGITLEDSVATARALVDDGADYISLSVPDAARPTTARPTELAATVFRRALPPAVPIVVSGGIWDRPDVDRALASGADAVAVARAGIVHPDWPRRIAAADAGPLRRPPVTAAELAAVDAGPALIDYLRLRRGFVAG